MVDIQNLYRILHTKMQHLTLHGTFRPHPLLQMTDYFLECSQVYSYTAWPFHLLIDTLLPGSSPNTSQPPSTVLLHKAKSS